MRNSGTRHVAREFALRVLYGHEMLKKGDEEKPLSPTANWWTADDNLSVLPEAERFAKQLYNGVQRHGEQIDRTIVKHALNWRISRMGSVDRNILRLSIYELLHCPETAPNIILDEALELAKCYGTEESARFINGILDSATQKIRNPKKGATAK
jgi:transcription antitermination protein NusB